MRIRILRRVLATGWLALTVSGCHRADDGGLSPRIAQPFIIPSPGTAADSVLAVNGPPDRRERSDSLDFWVYARSVPEGTVLRNRTATVWFRRGVVVRTDVRDVHVVPTPTIPERQ